MLLYYCYSFYTMNSLNHLILAHLTWWITKKYSSWILLFIVCMQIFLPRNLFAEAYYPAHGSFVAKRYSIIHGTWTPKQKMEILEKWIVLCSTVSAANGEWKCPLQALTDWRHDFILRETIVHTESPMQVVDINSGSIGSSPKYFTYADNSVYYSAYRPWVGTELFKSSVFTTGATLVQDIATGSLGSFPSNFASVNNTIYFSANDGILGQELRKANSSGSQIVFDLIPWSGGSNPSFLKNIHCTIWRRIHHFHESIYGRLMDSDFQVLRLIIHFIHWYS